MKKYILFFIVLSCYIVACKSKEENRNSPVAAGIQLPYVAHYATDFTNNIPDSDLLLVLNSYRYWEIGDLKALRTTMGDSVFVNGSNGFKFAGPTGSLMNYWTQNRDSLSSVSITMYTWMKSHSVKDSIDFINVWYKETDTYKTGKVDSANYEDDNRIKDGKILWYSSHEQKL
jgi:hypothetical protein